jgi:hypothetical protein
MPSILLIFCGDTVVFPLGILDIVRCRAAGPGLALLLDPAPQSRPAIGPEQAVEWVVGPVPGLAGSDGRRRILGGSRLLAAPRWAPFLLFPRSAASEVQGHRVGVFRPGSAPAVVDEVVVPPRLAAALPGATAHSWSVGSVCLCWFRFWRPFGSSIVWWDREKRMLFLIQINKSERKRTREDNTWTDRKKEEFTIFWLRSICRPMVESAWLMAAPSG